MFILEVDDELGYSASADGVWSWPSYNHGTGFDLGNASFVVLDDTEYGFLVFADGAVVTTPDWMDIA